ncbi:lipase chaperone, partial [Burkholderia pseudomallei]
VALYCAAVAVAAGAVWYVVVAQSKRDAGASPASPELAASAPVSVAARAEACSAASGLPASLAGASAPRLPLDAHGHLAK